MVERDVHDLGVCFDREGRVWVLHEERGVHRKAGSLVRDDAGRLGERGVAHQQPFSWCNTLKGKAGTFVELGGVDPFDLFVAQIFFWLLMP